MMEPEFMRLQRAFTAHLRDPEVNPAPEGHEERRLSIYRYAIEANIDRFMRDNYPRVHQIMTDVQWRSLVRDYLLRHVARAAAFIDVPLEFLAYLEHERQVTTDPPFLYELAHFDWLETLLGADERVLDLASIDSQGDLLEGIPVANPILSLVTYRYPVHAINADYQPTEPPPKATRIAAFRDQEYRYGFLDLNEPAARLLELVIEARARSGADIIKLIALELGQHDMSALLSAGSTILARMLARGAILGTAR